MKIGIHLSAQLVKHSVQASAPCRYYHFKTVTTLPIDYRESDILRSQRQYWVKMLYESKKYFREVSQLEALNKVKVSQLLPTHLWIPSLISQSIQRFTYLEGGI